MSPRVPVLGVACALSLSSLSLFAQQDLPPVDAATILRELEKIELTQKQALLSSRQTAAAQIKAAAASPTAAANLYEAAVEATQFEGTKNKGGAYAEWKSSRAPILRTKEAQTALQLHLKYLSMSLERKNSDKPELFAAPSLNYAVEVGNADEMFLKQGQTVQGPAQSDRDKEAQALQREAMKLKDELLNKSLNDSVFVKWLRLGSGLPKGEDWELTPGNISGILEKNVRTVFRKEKNPQLVATWEYEMKILADRASVSRKEHDQTEFNTVTRPRLELSRANDMVELGQKNRGATEIYGMIKTYPQHPDFSKWVQRLRELLQPASQPATEAPATPESTPAP